MDETGMRLDGNAMAGKLAEVFVPDMTKTRFRCASCGAVGEMGAQMLYMTPQSPGAVLRCSSCDEVLMVMANHDGTYRYGAPGVTWMELPKAAAQS